MDYFSNLKKATADVTYKVVKKTEDIVETSKIKYRIYDLKNEVKKIQTEIGKEVYSAYAEEREVSGDIEDKCRELDELYEKIEALSEQLD